MARVLMLIVGLALLALGVWLCWLWWEPVRTVLLAGVAILAVVAGLFLLVFGISEVAGAAKPKT